METVILAAGKGRRLLPLTATRPKPMIPFINKPLIEYLMNSLIKIGIERATILVDYLADRIINYIGDGSRYGIEIVYEDNNEPFGTAGAVKKVVDKISDTFLIISADLITDINLNALIESHKKSGCEFTIALSKVEDTSQYGVAQLNPSNQIIRFQEKPKRADAFSNLVNAGVYVAEPAVFKHVPKSMNFDFSRHLFPKLLSENESINGYPFKGYWNDVGRPSNYLFAVSDALQGKCKIEGLKETVMSSGDEGILVTGNNCIIKRGLIINGFCVLGNNVSIGEDVEISNSVIWSGTEISDNCKVFESVIGENVKIFENVLLDSGTVIGDRCFIGRNSKIGQNIKLWAGSRLGEGTVMVSD